MLLVVVGYCFSGLVLAWLLGLCLVNARLADCFARCFDLLGFVGWCWFRWLRTVVVLLIMLVYFWC